MLLPHVAGELTPSLPRQAAKRKTTFIQNLPAQEKLRPYPSPQTPECRVGGLRGPTPGVARIHGARAPRPMGCLSLGSGRVCTLVHAWFVAKTPMTSHICERSEQGHVEGFADQ